MAGAETGQWSERRLPLRQSRQGEREQKECRGEVMRSRDTGCFFWSSVGEGPVAPASLSARHLRVRSQRTAVHVDQSTQADVAAWAAPFAFAASSCSPSLKAIQLQQLLLPQPVF